MVYELVGSRVLAPHLGSSTYVWTSLIGVILGSLSVGYWGGGRIADGKAGLENLGGIVFLAAAVIGITTCLKDPILEIIGINISDLRWKSVLASILLFSPASILLGSVSPYAVKLKSKTLENLGSTVGKLYALSTIGSIVGTFAAGFYLIPTFGTNKILVIISCALTAAAILTLPARKTIEKAGMGSICLAITMGGGYLDKRYNGPFPLLDVDTQYSRVRITDKVSPFRMARKSHQKNTGDQGAVRLLQMSNTLNSGIYHDSDELLFKYTRFFRLAKHFQPNVRTSVMIGGGAFVYPRDFLRMFPQAAMDVVEIDPALTDLAKQYFRLRDDPRLKVINEDGRTFLNRAESRYDVLFCDAFASVYSIPYQLTTRESVRQMYRLLNDNGVALVNVISGIRGDNGRFLRAEHETFRSVFPHVYLFQVDNRADATSFQNIMLVAVKGEKAPGLKNSDSELNEYLSHLWRQELPSDTPVLTDDYAPVEHYINLGPDRTKGPA
jgi:spermidine synthase